MMAASPGNRRSDQVVIGSLSVMAVGTTALMSWNDGQCFTPYFGSIPPTLAILSLSIAGAIGLQFLQQYGRFRVCDRSSLLHGLTLSSVLAVLFAAIVLAVDLTVGFPEDINVPWPWSALFYPVMAYAAEMVFHVIPLALIQVLSATGHSNRQPRCMIEACIPAVALLEPAFQWYTGYSGKPFSGMGVYVVSHV